MFLTDKRTLVAIAPAGGTNVWITYPHGLGKTPDTVIIRYNQPLGTATQVAKVIAIFDASNVSLQNISTINSPTMEVSTIVFHSIIV